MPGIKHSADVERGAFVIVKKSGRVGLAEDRKAEAHSGISPIRPARVGAGTKENTRKSTKLTPHPATMCPHLAKCPTYKNLCDLLDYELSVRE